MLDVTDGTVTSNVILYIENQNLRLLFESSLAAYALSCGQLGMGRGSKGKGATDVSLSAGPSARDLNWRNRSRSGVQSLPAANGTQCQGKLTLTRRSDSYALTLSSRGIRCKHARAWNAGR